MRDQLGLLSHINLRTIQDKEQIDIHEAAAGRQTFTITLNILLLAADLVNICMLWAGSGLNTLVLAADSTNSCLPAADLNWYITCCWQKKISKSAAGGVNAAYQ